MDEADEMLNMGFTDSINAILADVPQERKHTAFLRYYEPGNCTYLQELFT